MRTYGIKSFASDLFHIVNHSDYNKGPWMVSFRGKSKLCSNQTTAKAWASFFRRQVSDGWTATIERCNPSELLAS